MRVLVADDNALIRIGLRAALEGLDGVTSVAVASDGAEAIEIVQKGEIDVVLLDVRMPGMDGLTALPRLAAMATVVMLTHSDGTDVVAEAMSQGASGFIVHGALEPEAIVAALRACRAGGSVTAGLAPWGSLVAPRQQRTPLADLLSPREAEVMTIVATGAPNHRIAKQLFLSEKTVKNHINSIFSKLHAENRAHAIALWLGQADGSGGPEEDGSALGPGAVVGASRDF